MIAGILTVSDRSSRGERDDAGGPALEKWLGERGAKILRYEIVPDEQEAIAAKLVEWADSGRIDIILTTGGTGVSPRDVTPEATSKVLQKEIPGFGELMRMKSLEKTPHASLSRALAGVRGTTLIVNLPGSPKGAVENLEAIWDAVPHAISKIRGDQNECAPSGPDGTFRD